MFNYLATHYLEILATLTGVISVYLVGKENIWNYFYGIICVSLYCYIFYSVKLYADMCLQVIFFALQIYGLHQWLYGGRGKSSLSIRSATSAIYLYSAITTGILFISISYVLQHYTDSNTVYTDAMTTSLSLVAQALMARKWLQHWIIWVIVDIVSIYMYIIKDLYLTCGLHFVFLCLCVFGYYHWWKQYSLHHATSKTPSPSPIINNAYLLGSSQ